VTAGPAAPQRAAIRLLRWYPASWRARYGEEFTELLLAEFDEQPRNWRRTADIVGNGLLARLSSIGLTSHGLDPARQVRASLATAACAGAAFWVFGLAMLAQLAIGWQWAVPHAGTSAATLLMSAGAGALGGLAVLGAVPLAWCAAAGLARREARRQLLWPAALVLAGGCVLVAGAHHFQNAWPGTGGTAARLSPLPAGPAAFSWASTLSFSSYWAHPAALRAFPPLELAWMAASPLALLCLVGGAAVLVRRLRLSARLLVYQARLAGGAAVAMTGFLAGAAWWVFGQGAGPDGLFHAGVVDVAGLAAMALALLAGASAAVSARRLAGCQRRAAQSWRGDDRRRPGAGPAVASRV
jgi:hypothetical protein